MIHPETHLAGDDSARPAGSPVMCFYCHVPLGTPHLRDCVMRSRTVVVRAIIEYTVSVPESWTPGDIEFHRNESSWCKRNGIDEIASINDDQEREDCPCSMMRYEYVREATIEDEVQTFGEPWAPDPPPQTMIITELPAPNDEGEGRG